MDEAIRGANGQIRGGQTRPEGILGRRLSNPDSYPEQILRQSRRANGYLLQLADTMDQTYAEGSGQNQATLEVLILLSLGSAPGCHSFAAPMGSFFPGGFDAPPAASRRFGRLNAQRGPHLSNAALAIYLGLPAAHGLYFGVGAPRSRPGRAGLIFTQAPYQLNRPGVPKGPSFGRRFQRSTEPGSAGRKARGGAQNSAGGYLVGRIRNTGYAEFIGAVPGGNGLSPSETPDRPLVMLGFGENKPDGKKPTVIGGSEPSHLLGGFERTSRPGHATGTRGRFRGPELSDGGERDRGPNPRQRLRRFPPPDGTWNVSGSTSAA